MRDFADEQKQHLTGLIAKWRQKLRLQHWDITVEWDEEPRTGDCILEVSPYTDIHEAIVRIGSFFDDIDPPMQESAVVHELIHCHAQPAWDVVEQVLEELGSQARAHMTEVLRQRFEVMVDALAKALSPIE